MHEDVITVVGRLGADPTLKPVNGDRVASFRLGSTPRRKEGDAWVDGRTNWYSVEAWGTFAEHVAASLRKGDLVVVVGTLRIEDWESGDRRGTSVRIRADHIGPTLRSGAVAKDRRPRGSDEPSPADGEGEGAHEPAMALATAHAGAADAPGQAWAAPLSEPETPF